jgi:endonuclease YncB( thermonuclease family)
LLLALLAFSAGAETMHGEVIAIADGDTITIRGSDASVIVRIAGIDAPERRQPFGRESTANMRHMLFGHAVAVDWHKHDRYGRVVGKVLLDGVDVGLAQIKDGAAWHYKAYAHEQPGDDRNRYAAAEIEARNERRGLWGKEDPVPPWDWRMTRKNKNAKTQGK